MNGSDLKTFLTSNLDIDEKETQVILKNLGIKTTKKNKNR